MIGFYYGNSVPGNQAEEGIYFVKNNGKYAIYTKLNNNSAAEFYGEPNEVTSKTLEDLWNKIGEDFVAKSIQVAGLEIQNGITIQDMQNALELQGLAYQNEATGTITDYVTEVQGVNYTPTGTVEVILGAGQTATIISKGKYTPVGTIEGNVIPQGNISFAKNSNGFAVSGSVSAPSVNITPNKENIKQITGVGTLPSYTPAQYTAPSFSSSSNSFTTEGVVASIESEVLKIVPAATSSAIISTSFDAGGYTAAVFDPGTLPTIDDTLSVLTDIGSVEVSEPIFTGDKISATFTGESSDISATFTGTEQEIEVSGTYTQVDIDSATFVGDSIVIKPELTKGEKAVVVN